MANYTVGYKQPSKKKVYNTVYNNSAMYIVWLDEIKRDGVDNEGRVLELKPKNLKNPIFNFEYITFYFLNFLNFFINF